MQYSFAKTQLITIACNLHDTPDVNRARRKTREKCSHVEPGFTRDML